MALNRFNDILNRVQNNMVGSMKKDVKDLRNDEFKAQMNKDRQKADNQQLWDKYKRTGEKIDVPEFDASVQDLPENDENEKEIKVVPQEPKGTSFYVPSEQNNNYSLEQLAGNGMPEEEIPEPKEPKGTSFNLPKEENPEWDLEDLAGNGQRESEPLPQEETDDTIVAPEEEPTEEMPNEDLEVTDEPNSDDTIVEENNEGVETPEFDESDVADPNNEEETDFRKENPDSPFKTKEEAESFKEFLKKNHPEMSDEMADRLSKGDVSDLPDTPGDPNDIFVGDPEFDESDIVDPEDNPDIPTDEEIENAESGEEETPEEDTEEEESEEEEEEEPKEKTRTETGPINDDSDLIKKGSGVSVSDMVDRSQIPHYDYLSFFR